MERNCDNTGEPARLISVGPKQEIVDRGEARMSDLPHVLLKGAGPLPVIAPEPGPIVVDDIGKEEDARCDAQGERQHE